MAEALAHGAEVNWVNVEENKATPLIQAVRGVRDVQHRLMREERKGNNRGISVSVFLLNCLLH